MIRTNKKIRNKQKLLNITKVHTYNYRNAVYQGEISKEKGQRDGKGVIYVTDTHHFIVCNQFSSNKLNSHSLFFHSHSRYLYGLWLQSQPEGIAVFRMNEMLIIAEYKLGVLNPKSKILLVFEKYNTGVIVEALQDQSWEIVQKSDIICNDKLEALIRQCEFSSPHVPYLLIKYLNDYMVADKSFLKLRLINNLYYRFGFDQGLAIIFDDSYRLFSVGVHNKNSLTSFGVKFNDEKLGNKVEEGIFDGRNTFVFDYPNRPIYKIGQLYCKRHLSEVNFKNEIYKDPSEPYFQYFEDLLNSPMIRDLVGNVLQSPQKKQSFRRIMQQQPSKDESLKRYEKLEFPEFEIATFKRPQKQNLLIDKRQQQLRDLQASSIIRQNSHRHIETLEFEKLSEKNRLDILKKQLYINLSHKSTNRDQEESDRGRRNRIITMSPVDLKNVSKSRKKQDLVSEKVRNKDPYIYELPKHWREAPGQNLDKHLDIKINDFAEERSSRSRSISRNKKKIFEQCPNVIKDYSPRASASPSPFKNKMRSKIFSQTPDKSEKSRSRSSTRIFPQRKTPEKIQFSNPRPVSLHEPQSPHMIYDASLEKSESQSHIKAYPITMNRESNNRQRVSQSQQLVNQKDEKVQEYRKQQKVRVADYLAINTPGHKKTLTEEFSKKKNQVYRNQMKSEYGDYVYEPINIKATGNLPYVGSNHSLISNKSAKTFQHPSAKKGIEQSSPFKREKMSSYMNTTPYEYRQSETLSDFKRRLNYF